jgi:hypothetical protein
MVKFSYLFIDYSNQKIRNNDENEMKELKNKINYLEEELLKSIFFVKTLVKAKEKKQNESSLPYNQHSQNNLNRQSSHSSIQNKKQVSKTQPKYNSKNSRYESPKKNGSPSPKSSPHRHSPCRKNSPLHVKQTCDIHTKEYFYGKEGKD